AELSAPPPPPAGGGPPPPPPGAPPPLGPAGRRPAPAPALRDSAYVEPADAREIKDDPLYDEAERFVRETRRPSISAVQRKLKIGYNRAARFLEAMEQFGVVTPMNTDGSREVLG
ncbi:hypothetical protein I5F81_27520, partial [Pseudomonas aeruginosa]|nr:hypothetical protein [Pseudomonas aeruginosa]